MGSRRDRRDRALLHSTRYYPTDGSTRRCPDHPRVSPFPVTLRARLCWYTTCQFLAVHTFVPAVWEIDLEARGVAFGLVCFACIFITLWVSIGAGIDKNYETPTPVRNSHLFLAILSSLFTLLLSVLVLDKPSVPARMP